MPSARTALPPARPPLSPLDPTGPTLAGDLLVVLSLVIALAWILLNKRLMQRHSPVTVTAYGVAAGTAMLLLCVPVLYRQPFGPPPIAAISLKAWLALAASGLLCTASTTLFWNWGLTQVPASQAGVLLNMEPLIGSLLGVFLLRESLGPSARTGGALILAAALIITTGSRTRRREQLPSHDSDSARSRVQGSRKEVQELSDQVRGAWLEVLGSGNKVRGIGFTFAIERIELSSFSRNSAKRRKSLISSARRSMT